MVDTYQYLISISFKHNYFRDGNFKTLQVSFDESTQRLLKKLGLIVKPYHGGVHFLILNRELLNDTTINTPLRLFVDCNDSFYINYSDLPDYIPSNSVLYFNNLDLAPNIVGKQLMLQSEEYVGKKELASMTSGKLVLSKPKKNKEYNFQDVFGNDISSHINRLPNNNEGYAEYVVSNLQQGLIQVYFEGLKKMSVYYTPKTVWKKPLGILEFYLPQLYRHSGHEDKLDYVLNFNARSTIWKYFLVSPAYNKFFDLSIIDGTKEKVFKAPEKETVQESEVLVFESLNEIALSEFSTNNFQLVNKFDPILKMGNPVVIKVLPKASPEQLYRSSTTKESLYSHIYL